MPTPIRSESTCTDAAQYLNDNTQGKITIDTATGTLECVNWLGVNADSYGLSLDYVKVKQTVISESPSSTGGMTLTFNDDGYRIMPDGNFEHFQGQCMGFMQDIDGQKKPVRTMCSQPTVIGSGILDRSVVSYLDKILPRSKLE